jgi:hypothetical protein
MEPLNPYFQNPNSMNRAPRQPLLGQQIPGKQSLTELIGNPRRPMIGQQPMFGQRATDLRVPGQLMPGQQPLQGSPMIGQPMPQQLPIETQAQPMVGQQPLQSPAMPAQPMMGQPLQPSAPMLPPDTNGSRSLGGPMFQQLPPAIQKQLAGGQQPPQSSARPGRKARRLTGLGKSPSSNYMGGSPNFNEQTGAYIS